MDPELDRAAKGCALCLLLIHFPHQIEQTDVFWLAPGSQSSSAAVPAGFFVVTLQSAANSGLGTKEVPCS